LPWWCIPAIAALWRLRQEGREFEQELALTGVHLSTVLLSWTRVGKESQERSLRTYCWGLKDKAKIVDTALSH
jgi:hypothetical protein